jgi:hypothetical protein
MVVKTCIITCVVTSKTLPNMPHCTCLLQLFNISLIAAAAPVLQSENNQYVAHSQCITIRAALHAAAVLSRED